MFGRSKVLSRRKALHSIAVELNRANNLKAAEIRVLAELAKAAAKAAGGEAQAEAQVKAAETIAAPFRTLLATMAERVGEPVHATAEAATPAGAVEVPSGTCRLERALPQETEVEG